MYPIFQLSELFINWSTESGLQKWRGLEIIVAHNASRPKNFNVEAEGREHVLQT